MIALLAASGAALALALVLVAKELRARTQRRFEAMLRQVDAHLGSISVAVRDALDRSDEVRVGAARANELTLDALASTHTRHGYEAELEREVNRARTTQRPLSLVVLDVHELARAGTVERVAAEISALLGRITRTSDKVVRRGDDELVLLLPETPAEAAWRFHGRLRGELEKSFAQPGDGLTVLTDVVEWKPNETSQSFDARARRVIGHGNVESLERRADAHL